MGLEMNEEDCDRRWLRLLFGREFPFQDLLVLWDAIFSISNFELVNFIVVAMLTAVRSILLVGDYMTCLTNLMRYPSGVDVMFVIQYALHLMNPSVYTAPTVTSCVNKTVTLIQKTRSMSTTNQNSEKLGTTLGHIERLKSSKPPKWLSAKHHPLTLAGSGDGDGNIIEGFALDDPKVLKFGLDTMSMTLEIVQSKLAQYYSVLNHNLSESLNSDVKEALEGIKELCSLLETYQCQTTYSNVEPAFEAGETKLTLSAKKETNDTRKESSSMSVDEPIILERAVKKVPAGELQVFKQYLGGPITGAPMTDPLRSMRRMSYAFIDNLENNSSES